MVLALLSASFQSLPLLPMSKVGPSGTDFHVVGFVCISPMNSPVKLGVSPAAASTPKWFSISGLRLYFPGLEPWGCTVCFTPHLFLLVYLHLNVGPPGPPATSHGSASCSLPASCSLAHPIPQSAASLGPPAAVLPTPVLQPPRCHESSLPSCSSPPLLPVWMNVSSLTPWLSDFHTV